MITVVGHKEVVGKVRKSKRFFILFIKLILNKISVLAKLVRISRYRHEPILNRVESTAEMSILIGTWRQMNGSQFPPDVVFLLFLPLLLF